MRQSVSTRHDDPAADRERRAPQEDSLRQLTASVQHRLNNPLAALLAEAQLLAMDPALHGEHRMAVDRLIGLIRRLIGIVRNLKEDSDASPR